MENDPKKYNAMEKVLATINGDYISLSVADTKLYNIVLIELLDLILVELKKNAMFKKLFQRVFYGGSYYDGLRVGRPDEFDLDLLFSLPTYAKPVLSVSNRPGFLNLKMCDMDGFMKQPEAKAFYANFDTLFFDSNHYLDTQKVRKWMQSIITKALNAFPDSPINNKKKVLKTSRGPFEVSIHQGGPAFTLKASGPKIEEISIDLVPCFVFKGDKWPSKPFIPNPVPSKTEFFIVPKEPKNLSSTDKCIAYRYWRLSFQEQERELILGKHCLKPTIKMLKRMRDIVKHTCISSYFIKTVVLHIAKKEPAEFWNKNSLSYVFMYVFKKYIECLKECKIPYYWNSSNNLIADLNTNNRITQYYNQLQNILNEIERKYSTEPNVVAKYLCTPDELQQFLRNQ